MRDRCIAESRQMRALIREFVKTNEAQLRAARRRPLAEAPWGVRGPAYHEAGHALAALLCGRAVVEVSIHEVYAGGELRAEGCLIERDGRVPGEADAVIFLAGPVAVEMVTGELDISGGAEDLRLAHAWAESLGPSHHVAERHFARALARARALLGPHRVALDALAGALVRNGGRLIGGQIREAVAFTLDG